MPDRTARTAALWATAIAVPVAVLAAVLLFAVLRDRTQAAQQAASPAASPSTPAVRSTAPVPMAAPALPAPATAVCRSLMSKLPPAVRDRPARKVSAGAAQNAAYGDPAITVACGVQQPRVADETFLMSMKSMAAGVDYVCWYTRQAADATVWTTVNREIPVEITVPSVYEQPAQWANEFSDTVITAVRPRTDDVPAGCV